MKHSFIDEYSELDSLIHKLDPRTKLVVALAFVIAVVLTPITSWQAFISYFCVIVVSLVLSKLPLFYVLKRSLVVFPFVLMIALFIPFFKQGEVAGSYNIGLWQVSVTYSGLLVLANVVIKAWLCILSLILLSSTTKLADLLKGLQQFRVPQVIVLILSFMYRYIFVLADEVMRMKQARDSRNFGGRRLHQLKAIGNMIGTLFIRSYERGERVYAAMIARGFDGEVRTMRTLSFGRADAYFGIAFVLALIIPGVLWW
ncbi:MAG: cobalt ECF transporter T component CbiQ [Chloroflexi bacterium]|nr:cobalt ECF transporter T component CbiQ [Chloroflexota bacterium]MBM3173737.1 cobalt ECF transporter T component CbiQ [Chloroflexota bacterium]MBM3174161.1 cobalt ECF transporter T component CbiQ [Chloroflexota bacterium]MBM4449229.1 cobalt ECF transporter T component CbiQ [Chloroflexota bacterium]